MYRKEKKVVMLVIQPHKKIFEKMHNISPFSQLVFDDNGDAPDGNVLAIPLRDVPPEIEAAVRQGILPAKFAIGDIVTYNGEQSSLGDFWCGFSSRGEAYIIHNMLRNPK